MIVSLTQENLMAGLQKVARAVATKTTMPIVQNVMLSGDEGRLRISATNLEFAITTWVAGMFEREGSITVPYRYFHDRARTMPSGVVHLEVINAEGESDAEGGTLIMKSGRSRAQFACAPAADFPPIPKVVEGLGANLDPALLRQGIGLVTFSAASDESRPVLTGMNLKIEEHDLAMACADGFRLAVYSCKVEKPMPEKVNVIIPAKAADELNRLCDGQSSLVEMMLAPSAQQVMFKTADSELVSNLLTGSFPVYEQLIPEDNGQTTRAVLNISETRRAAQAAAVFARDGSNILRMEFGVNEESETPRELTISAVSSDLGDSKDTIGVEELEGEHGKIAFNVRYVQDILGAMDGDKLQFGMKDSSSPGVFRSMNGISYVHVIMPMYVNWGSD